MNKIMKNKKVPGTTYQTIFVSQNMIRKFHYFVIYNLSHSHDLIQKGFLLTPETVFADL